MSKTSAELRAELAAAEAAERTEREALRKSTPIRFKYTIHPAKPDSWHKVYDDTCFMFEIIGKCTNKEEAHAAGHTDHDTATGSMRYIVNTFNMRIVCPVGGGTMYISDSRFGEPDDADGRAFRRIGEFLMDHDQGGDITHIVEQFKRERDASNARRHNG